MYNPYSNINWSSIIKVPSCSHQHCENQAQFNNIVQSGMYRHYAISNYYRSEPVYPLSSKFTDIPENAISCQNAEHHGTNVQPMHFNGIGCTKVSGSLRHLVDGQWVYDQPVGFGGIMWYSAFKQVLDTLVYADGGGITINHPSWSNRHGGLSQAQIEEFLLYDHRVLGIETYNAQEEDWDFALWDALLLKRFWCYGFAATDHIGQFSGSPKGRNVLLSEDASEHDCLKAYREGRFYCQLHNTELAFSEISLNGQTYMITAPNATTISITIDGVKTTYNGNTASIIIPSNCTYVRAEADNNEDKVWCNPIFFKDRIKKKTSSFNKLIPFM